VTLGDCSQVTLLKPILLHREPFHSQLNASIFHSVRNEGLYSTTWWPASLICYGACTGTGAGTVYARSERRPLTFMLSGLENRRTMTGRAKVRHHHWLKTALQRMANWRSHGHDACLSSTGIAPKGNGSLAFITASSWPRSTVRRVFIGTLKVCCSNTGRRSAIVSAHQIPSSHEKRIHTHSRGQG
jgi:hypothetical protein